MQKEDRNKLFDFFSRDLNSPEKEEFLTKAGSDKEFVREFIKMTELNEIYEEVFGSKWTKNVYWKRIIRKYGLTITGLAAVLLLGLFIGIPKLKYNINPGKYLFNEYYEPFDVTLTRSSNIASNTNSNPITYYYLYSLYIQKEYKSLLSIDLERVDVKNLKEIAFIIQGISAIETGEFSKAENLFREVDNSSKYSPISNWYLVLLKIQNNQFDKVIPMLNEISNSNLIFMEKAIDLKKELIDKGFTQ